MVPAALSAQQAAEQVRAGAVVLDLRMSGDFSAGHPERAINVSYSEKSLAQRVDAVVADGVPLLLLSTDEAQARAAEVQLSGGGRRCPGSVPLDAAAWRAAGVEWRTLPAIDSEALADDPAARPYDVLDVREPIEWDSGHVPGAILISLGSLRERLDEIPRERQIAVICEAGVRSCTAASLLRAAGVEAVINVADGTAGYRKAGRPLQFPDGGTE
jgi:hydroxyacylglutathione hydrolase